MLQIHSTFFVFTLSVPNFSRHLSSALKKKPKKNQKQKNKKKKQQTITTKKKQKKKKKTKKKKKKKSLREKFICKVERLNVNSVDPNEAAHYEQFHLDLCCLQSLFYRLW